MLRFFQLKEFPSGFPSRFSQVFAVLFTQAVNDHLTDPDVKYDVLFEKVQPKNFPLLARFSLNIGYPQVIMAFHGLSWIITIIPIDVLHKTQ